jgi:hypothetical protein
LLSDTVASISSRVEKMDTSGTHYGRAKSEMFDATDKMLAIQQGKLDGKVDSIRDQISDLKRDVAVIGDYVRRADKIK